jgi:predicted TIM-barrel fold metal-dependent hydrolase
VAGTVLLVLALGALGVAGTLAHRGCGKKQSAAAARGAKKARFARIDVHAHISPDGVERALQIMETWGIDGMVNLSGMTPGPPHHALETQLAAARASGGRIAVFANAGFMRALRMANLGIRADYGNVMAEELALSKQLGAIGLKIPKGLGLGYPTPDGKRVLPVDDPGLDPLFDKAGELGMPVAIHTGDPKAFWLPADVKNERWDELQAHPEWSFRDQPVPSWEELYAAFERRVARHPKTIFIGVHFGNDPEDPDRVAQMLDKYPNLYIDTAARVPEIGRRDAAKMRLFYEKYQDRILFGTDLGVAAEQDGMMYGSNGANPPTVEDEARYFTSTWRYFETRDKQFESPTPIQGRWKIDGVGLPEAILRKIYFENAVRVLKWRPPPGPVMLPRSAASPAPTAAPASPAPAGPAPAGPASADPVPPPSEPAGK